MSRSSVPIGTSKRSGASWPPRPPSPALPTLDPVPPMGVRRALERHRLHAECGRGLARAHCQECRRARSRCGREPDSVSGLPRRPLGGARASQRPPPPPSSPRRPRSRNAASARACSPWHDWRVCSGFHEEMVDEEGGRDGARDRQRHPADRPPRRPPASRYRSTWLSSENVSRVLSRSSVRSGRPRIATAAPATRRRPPEALRPRAGARTGLASRSSART